MGYSKHEGDHLQVAARNFRMKLPNHKIRILDQVDREDQVRAITGFETIYKER